MIGGFFIIFGEQAHPLMKHQFDVPRLMLFSCLFMFSITISIVLIIYMVYAMKSPTNEVNIQLRLKVIDLCSLIAANVIGVVSTLLSVGARPHTPNENIGTKSVDKD